MKPGLSVATVRGTSDVIVFGPDEHEIYATIWGGETSLTGAVENLRPLVVLDPESDEDCQRLADALGTPGSYMVARQILRALAAPTPAEPMGLGAVVRDASGRLWCRTESGAWRAPGIGSDWPSLGVVEVLSEGWSE